MRRLLCIVLVIVAVALGGVAMAADLDPGRLAAVDQATETFLALAKNAFQSGAAPRLADPAVKPLLDTVFGTADLTTGGPLPFAQLAGLNDWTTRIVAVGSVYVFAGTGIPDFDHLTSLDEKQEQQIIRNTVAFAPEIGRYFDAEMQIEQAMVACVMAELAVHPATYQSQEAQQGLETIRGGLKETLTGVMTTFLTPGLGISWVYQRLPVLAAVTPTAAKFLSPQDRADLRDVAAEVAERIDDAQAEAKLTEIARVFGS